VFLVPIGHERGFVSRVPWATIAIAGLCLVLQVRASVLEPPIEAKAEKLTLEMMQTERELKMLSSGQPSGPKLPGFDMPGLPEAFGEVTGVQAGPTHPETDEEKAAREAKIATLTEKLSELSEARDAVIEQMPSSQLGYRPSRGGFWRMITSAFAHGGWMHLFGNLLFLYLVGCNIEDRWGRSRYAVFYLCAAVCSALAFRLWHPGSQQVLVGASGAIAAVMGAFTVCFSATRIRFFYAYWITFKPRVGTFFAPAWVALLLWFLEQSVMSIIEASANMGVAYSAHVGGFLFGLTVAVAMRVSGLDHELAEKAEFSSEEGAQWSDDPVYAEAKGLALEGHRAAALSAAEDVLRRLPDHTEARELALKLSLQLADEERIKQHARAAFTHWTRSSHAPRVLATYRQIREQNPELDLGEPALRVVVTANAQDGAEPLVAIDVAQQLIGKHPGSAILPRAMWSAALAQEQLQRPDLAQRTLENLLAVFPMDPFGERARRKLHGESLRPPQSA
jgi:membrane associated rhomboid family serine protease